MKKESVFRLSLVYSRWAKPFGTLFTEEEDEKKRKEAAAYRDVTGMRFLYSVAEENALEQREIV